MGDEVDHLADEDRDGDVEQGDHKSGGEQPEEKRLGLARKVPIESHQPGRRYRLLRNGRGLQRAFEKTEHGLRIRPHATPLGGSRAAGFYGID